MLDELDPPPGDRAVAELAARQHGVVAIGQLRALGLSASAVRSRATAGRLHRIHRGVYAVGHPLVSGEGRWIAAVLACGSRAVLSHRSAAALWGLRPTARTAVDVTVPWRAGRSRPGIDIHRVTSLHPADTTTAHGIPCTTVARTLLDLAEVVARRSLERAVDQAEVLRLFDRHAVDDVLERAAGRRGAAALRAVLAETEFGSVLTRSELEERFLSLCLRASLPRPEVNAWLCLDDGAVQVDFLWRAHELIVETDGHRSHGTRGAFERDRRRDQRLMRAGWRVVRFTWRQIAGDPTEVAETIAALYSAPEKRRGWDSNPRGR